MARLCADRRPEIRTQALTLLQRSLLISDLQSLQSNQWEFCFIRVLFPMLRKLLESKPITGASQHGGNSSRLASGWEETKLRAAMMLNKVFLQHLLPLSSLPTFTALWLTILDFMQQFISTASTDLLADALPESLKNMLLVMDTSGNELFFVEATGQPTQLWSVTWQKIDAFLPNLKQETFGDIQCKPVQVAKPETTNDEVKPEEKVTDEKLAATTEVATEVKQSQPPKLEANISVLEDDVFLPPPKTEEVKQNYENPKESHEAPNQPPPSTSLGENVPKVLHHLNEQHVTIKFFYEQS